MSNDNFERAMNSLRQSQANLEALLAGTKEQLKEIKKVEALLNRLLLKVEAQRKIIEEGRKGDG